ncbi:MAG: peptide-methionine (S)-S-oxide reductase MsrA [Chlamydiales bacterium]|nr:peptide-methionine (S)-S-oxide reductase MsrA [Chlamydiales bacterium]
MGLVKKTINKKKSGRGMSKKKEEHETAIFAGGCFWCTQHDFDSVPGVISTTVGYTGGSKAKPSYEEVSTGDTGHVEAIQLVYDPAKVSYEKLLDIYFHQIDPTRNDGQFCDIGSQYRPVIFYANSDQQKAAENYKQKLTAEKKMGPILVEILPAKPFYPAEKYHQEYYKKDPLKYKFYSSGSGREKRLKQLWNHDT